ncbi:MAG TPA: TolC family protein, partial [Candidatus Binatia bacterium]|nr:TolC family protein [Candidatus Binatia bacterium]
RDALRLSEIRYRGGVASYLEVLDSDTRRFDAELDLVRANFDERLAVVQLYRALGGGWRPADVTEPPARSDTGAPVAPVARRSLGGAPRDR